MRHVYFDHQAATPMLSEVLDAMLPFFRERFGSASSLHRHGLEARDALDRAREQVAAMIGAASAEEIIFTSSGTEAANLAIKGAAFANAQRGNHLVVTSTDHPAVLNSAEFLEKHGFSCTRVGVNGEGFLSPEAVRAALTDQTILVCIHHANHDLGTIQPVAEICALAADRGVPVFVDASASGGWLPIDVQALGASLLSLAPHRFYGPKGAGVLYRHRRARLTSLIHGGIQEGGRRAGTENVPAIVGAGVAAEIAQRQLTQRMARGSRLQKRLWAGLERAIPYTKLNGPPPGPTRLCTNLNISFEFVEGEGVMLMADVQGIAMASGAACVSKALKASPVLTAIGVDHALAQGNVLITLGQANDDADIDYALEVLPKVVAKLRDMSPLWDDFQRGEIDSVLQPRGRPTR